MKAAAAWVVEEFAGFIRLWYVSSSISRTGLGRPMLETVEAVGPWHSDSPDAGIKADTTGARTQESRRVHTTIKADAPRITVDCPSAKQS